MDDAAEAWQATLQASESLEALQDAIFSAEEVIQSHAHIWDSTDTSAARLLVRLDEVRDRLSQAREAAQQACLLPPSPNASERLAQAVSSVHSQFHKIHADALDVELLLENERGVLTAYDMCMQCERLLSKMASDLPHSTTESPGSRAAWEAKQRHTFSTCAQRIAAMRASPPTQPAVQARYAQIESRWEVLQKRCHAEGILEVTDMLASTLAISTPMSKRVAGDDDDARKRRWSLGTPSRLPRTPSSLPRTPHATGRIPSSSQRPRTTGRIRTDRSASASTMGSSPDWIGLSAPAGVDSPSHAAPTRPRSALDRPKTPTTRTPSSLGKRLARRTSFLPRPTHALGQGAHASPVPPVPPLPAALGPYTPHRTSVLGDTKKYVPDHRDALDIGVARVCNARSVPVERLDEPHTSHGDITFRNMREMWIRGRYMLASVAAGSS
ncbi:hypothetical protein MNAN1_003374 [Malassezia nana]|uniref:Uncharacterized protein n=1 Tax=Malassezia nana TaxID=180528 RepID=A0AAF0EP76_9BASI|nr:hypothetical protein MNAN1_003374 [Malassezia nana]